MFWVLLKYHQGHHENTHKIQAKLTSSTPKESPCRPEYNDSNAEKTSSTATAETAVETAILEDKQHMKN